jgi:TOMM system kinase/cyclase fusion protein
MSAANDARLEPGTIFQGSYEVSEALGAGSFGWVYKARQLSTGQDVAIKVLRIQPGDRPEESAAATDRFRREMRLCAGLSHPNIVRLIDSGETGTGMLYAVFEYVPGTTLREVLSAEGRLPPQEAVHLMTQVLDALSCAHARGVVHRDLKPENIMITKTGARRNALVLDFGLGGVARDVEQWSLPRITLSCEMMGTPCYAAPEQLRGEPTTTRSDLYSWGLIFLECLTGELAVQGASAHDVILRQLGPEPVCIPDELRRQPLGRLLEAVTAKAVERRDVTVEGLLEALAGASYDAARPLAGPLEPAAEAERRQLTIVSCRLDVVQDGPRLLDIEEVEELIHAQHALWAEVAARRGGRLASVLADRALLVFGFPQAAEDDVRRAARVALRIVAETARAGERLERERRLRLEVRAGVHTGVVVVRQLRRGAPQVLDELVGITPQLAARLDERAGPGGVLVSGDAHALLRGELAAEPFGRIEVGGAAVAVFRLGAERPELVSWMRETPLVGRAAQLRLLLAAWQRAQTRPAAVLIMGEPGIGKSRLVRELRRRVPPEAWLECRCIMEQQRSPLRPIVDLLARVGPLDAVLRRVGLDLEETAPLLGALLSPPAEDDPARLPFTPERQKELTLQAILALLLGLAQEEPIVLVVEDLHWADPTTLELLTLLVQELRSAEAVPAATPSRLCAVFTARPDFAAPWSLEDVPAILLPRLVREEVAEMITAGLAAGATIPRQLLDRIATRSDGIPLFVEEVTRVLVEAGGRTGDGQLQTEAVEPEIPPTLRGLLAERLDRVSPSARETVQLAAVLGREFRYEVLRAVARTDESLVRLDVRELLDAGLLFARRAVRAETYVFKHSLVREVAYESMTRARRRTLHARVASTLAQRFPEVEREQPEILALHYEHAQETGAAVEHWFRAGNRALRTAAYVEAIQQLEHALALLETVPQSASRSRLEIGVLTALGTALFSTRGYTAEEVERTFARARDLAGELAEDVSLKVLAGLAGVYLTRGDRDAAAALLPRLQRLAARTDDPVASITGHALLGVYAFWAGEFEAAWEHTAVGIRLHGTPEFRDFARDYGWDGGLFCHAYGMGALWHLGHADQAEALRREMLEIAERSRNPYSLALALGFGTTLGHDRGEPERTTEQAGRLAALATEQKLYAWLAIALCAEGGAAVQRGEAESGVAQIQQGLALLQGTGMRASYCYYLTYLAEACLAAGHLDAGLAAVDESLGLCAMLTARFHEANAWRLRGELLRAKGEAREAEATFRQALEIARRQRARAYELRAATGLARLLAGQGRPREALEVLPDVYAGLAEGRDTADLRAARAILDELG